MSYSARNDVPLKAAVLLNLERPDFSDGFLPSAVFQLDTGALVAVYFAAKRTPANTLSCRVAAWLVDDEGDAQQSIDEYGFPTGNPIVTEFKHNASIHEVRTYTPNGLAACLRDLVLGEEPCDNPPIKWSKEIREQVNVRHAIDAALAMGDTIDLVEAVLPTAPIPTEGVWTEAEQAAHDARMAELAERDVVTG